MLAHHPEHFNSEFNPMRVIRRARFGDTFCLFHKNSLFTTKSGAKTGKYIWEIDRFKNITRERAQFIIKARRPLPVMYSNNKSENQSDKIDQPDRIKVLVLWKNFGSQRKTRGGKLFFPICSEGG